VPLVLIHTSVTLGDNQKEDIARSIRNAVSAIDVLGIEQDYVSVSYAGYIDTGDPKRHEAVAIITGMFDKRERDEFVRKNVVIAVTEVLRGALVNSVPKGCSIKAEAWCGKPLNPDEDGFYAFEMTVA